MNNLQALAKQLADGFADKPKKAVGSVKELRTEPITEGVGFSELEEIADQCPLGNYSTGRKFSPTAAKKFTERCYIEYCTDSSFVPSPAMELGSAVESRLAQDGMEIQFIKMPSTNGVVTKQNKKNWNTWIDAIQERQKLKDELKNKDSKAFQDPYILLPESYKDKVNDMQTVGGKHPVTRRLHGLLQQQKLDMSYAGVRLTGYKDFTEPGKVYELKTINDLRNIVRAYKFGPSYHILQAGFYALEEDVEEVIMIYFQTEPPHKIQCVSIKEDKLEYARNKAKWEIEDFSFALEHGFEKAYEKKILRQI